MKSTTSINLNLQLPNYSVAVYAVQGDTMSREIEAALFDGQTPFTPPAGALGTVRYYKPDGTSGFYDTLEDEETVAVTWDDNVATIRLAEQTVTVPGEVLVQLSFYSADAERLSAFTFRLFVEKNPYSDQEFESTDYYSVLTARIAAVLNVTTHAPSINNLGHWVLWDDTAQEYYDSGINATGPQGPTGPTGPQGTSIVSTSKASGTGAAGTTDVYNVNLSDGTVAGTFNVYQGQDGQGSPGSATPLMDGTPSAGSANTYAREDHRHPSDTSKANATDLLALQTTVSGIQGDISALDDGIGIVIDGNTASQNVAENQYVFVKDSTITGVDDGLYTANANITAGDAFTQSDLTKVLQGGLNALSVGIGFAYDGTAHKAMLQIRHLHQAVNDATHTTMTFTAFPNGVLFAIAVCEHSGFNAPSTVATTSLTNGSVGVYQKNTVSAAMTVGVYVFGY